MKNKLSHLNDHLFAALERLNDESLKTEQLDKEIARCKAITNVSEQIILNARLVLDAQKAIGERIIEKAPDVMGLEPSK